MDRTLSQPAGSPKAPEPWTQGATRRTAFHQGQRAVLSIPGIILFSTMLGFGALARDLGYSLGQAVFLTATIFALPAQVALIDQIGRGAALASAAFAVALTSIRLMPMTVALMPYLRDGRTPRWLIYIGSHFVAITGWVVSLSRLPQMPVELRVPFYFGIGTTLLIMTVFGTICGHAMASALPPIIAGALLFMTPIYFALSLLGAAGGRADFIAIGLGMFMGPVLYWYLPGFDLILTGLIGGTIAYLAERRAGA